MSDFVQLDGKWYAPVKDPADVIDYVVDFSLLVVGDSVGTATVTAEPDLIVQSSSVSGDKVIAWLTGGVAGESYNVTVNVVTAGNRTFERSFTVPVRQL